MKKGFTLIEVLIYIGIIGLVVTSFVAFSLSISGSRNKNYVIQEVHANARVALDLIGQKIRASKRIIVASSTFDSDPGELHLEMATSTWDPTIIKLSADDGALQIQEGGSGAAAIIADEAKVTSLLFRNLSASSSRENVQVELTVEYNNMDSDVEFDYSQTLQTSVSVRQ